MIMCECDQGCHLTPWCHKWSHDEDQLGLLATEIGANLRFTRSGLMAPPRSEPVLVMAPFVTTESQVPPLVPFPSYGWPTPIFYTIERTCGAIIYVKMNEIKGGVFFAIQILNF